MFLSALLKSFSQIAREKSRRKSTQKTYLQVEAVEDRVLLSSTNGIPGTGSFGGAGGNSGKVNPLTSIPTLNSRPSAPVTIYLDFDGHTETQDWPSARSDGQSGPVITPVYDLDNDLTTFSDEELRTIEEIWYRMSEDYAPFNVNVTTVDPGRYNDFEAVLVSFGGDGAWIGSPGGIAFINSFNGGPVNTSYVFTDNTGRGGLDHAKGSALAGSHEVGHMLGLLHHSVYDANGNQTAQYDSGRPDLGPIMGAPYGSQRETWSLAPDSNGPTSIQDDLAIITGARNRVIAYRVDDHGDTFSTATALPAGTTSVGDTGVIEQNDDVDMFRFETDSGPISFSVEGLNLKTKYSLSTLSEGTNLDLVLSLYDARGTLIIQDSPTSSLFASISTTVAGGVYYIGVSGTGQYGALGEYTLTGTVIPLPVVPTMIAPSGTLPNALPTFQWSVAGNSASYDLQVDNLTLNRAGYYSVNVSANSHTPPNQFPEGSYQARVRSVQANGQVSAWSEFLAFTIDIPAPTQPVMTRPQGDIADAFPVFEWNPAQNASSYSLWVSNLDTNERVIYRTSHLSTTYSHFSALPDARYRAWVRSFNTVGEFSAWSSPVDFTIDTPIPVAPTLTAPAAVTSSSNPRFIFTNVEGAARYDLWLNNLSTGKGQYLRVTDIPRTASFYDPPALPQGNYTAWIRAVNGNGEASPWSAPRSFTVDILAPTKPTLTGPKGDNNSLTVTTVNPTFTWTAATRATQYDLWVNNMTLGISQYLRKSDITSTSFTALTNLKQGLHRAFVRGINSAGEVGEWSAAYEFTVDEPAPLIPTIVAPTSNPAGSVENANPTFQWTIEADAPFYELQIDNVSLNKASVISVKGLTAKSYTIPTIQRLGEYTYSARVRAYNSSGDVGEWSAAYRIRVDVPEPTTPIIVGPTGSSRDTTPQFQWHHTSTSFRYEILVRDTERNETISLNVIAFQLTPDQSQAIYVLPNDKAFKPSTYRFWVRAFNSLGQASSWSTAQTFVIQASFEPGDAEPKSPMNLDEPVLVSLLTGAERDVLTEREERSVSEQTEFVPSERSSDEVEMLSESSFDDAMLPSDMDNTESEQLLDSALQQMFDPASGMNLAMLMSDVAETM